MASASITIIYFLIKIFLSFTRKSIELSKGIGLPISLLFLSLSVFFVFFEGYVIEQMYLRSFNYYTSIFLTVVGFILGFEVSERYNYYLSEDGGKKKDMLKFSIDYFIFSLIAVFYLVVVYILILFI